MTGSGSFVAGLAALALGLSAPAEPGSVPPPELDFSTPPGGYWDPGERPVVAPKDGEEELLAGSILLPLGILSTATGAAMVWMTMPGHCQSRSGAVGFDFDDDACDAQLALNAVRTAYGAAALISGAVLLAVGAHRRRQHARWKQQNFRASLSPTGPSGRAGATASLVWRF